MSLIKKRVHLYEVKDGITYDEYVDVYTSTSAVIFNDGETLQDKIDNDFVNAEQLGNLDDLETEDKSNLVASLNEINGVVQENDNSINSLGESGYAFAFGRETLDNTWGSVSTLPYTNFYGGSVIVYNNQLHIFGGPGNYTAHYKHNGSNWESVSTLPYNFYWGGVVIYNNELHILGSDISGTTTKHYKYDGSTWSSVSTLPYDFSGGNAVVYNNEVHILGGNSGTQKHYKWNGSTWVSVSSLPYYFYNASAIIFGTDIHILGSNNSNGRTKHYKYNGSTWVSVSSIPYNFVYGCAVVYKNQIHILGSSYNTSNYRYHYYLNGSSWTSFSTLPYNFYNGCALVYKGLINILGGEGGSSNHYQYNSGTKLTGYVKKDTQIYQPNGHAYSDNLTTLEDGLFEVTEDGLVELILDE